MAKAKAKEKALKARPLGKESEMRGANDPRPGIAGRLAQDRETAQLLTDLRRGSTGCATAYLCRVPSNVPGVGMCHAGAVVESPGIDLDPSGEVWIRLEKFWENPGASANMLQQGDPGSMSMSNARIVLDREV